MATTEAERRLHASIAAHESWARTENRSARTAAARAALDQKFLDEANGDPVRAAHLRKAHFGRLARRERSIATQGPRTDCQRRGRGGRACPGGRRCCMSRRIEVEYLTRSCALVRGYGSRDLVQSRLNRLPVWSSRSRGWVVQPTADDVIALAEDRGYQVVVIK